MLKGLLVGGITLGVAAVFPEALVFPFLAVVLGVMAGAYPGMAMADPRSGSVPAHWAVAVLLTTLGLAGLWISPALLGLAFLLHCLWSFLLRSTALGDWMTEGFPSFSIPFDLVLAGFALYVWSAGP